MSKKQDQAKRDRTTEALVLQTLMGTKDGRRYVWNKLGEANVFADVDGVVQDHAALAYFMGKRSLGLHLLRALGAHPNEYIQMIRESANIEQLQKEEKDERPDFDT